MGEITRFFNQLLWDLKPDISLFSWLSRKNPPLTRGRSPDTIRYRGGGGFFRFLKATLPVPSRVRGRTTFPYLREGFFVSWFFVFEQARLFLGFL